MKIITEEGPIKLEKQKSFQLPATETCTITKSTKGINFDPK